TPYLFVRRKDRAGTGVNPSSLIQGFDDSRIRDSRSVIRLVMRDSFPLHAKDRASKLLFGRVAADEQIVRPLAVLEHVGVDRFALIEIEAHPRQVLKPQIPIAID